jgi:hypothetical protein
MLRLSPHGEIAFPMAVNKRNVAYAVKVKADVERAYALAEFAQQAD